MNLGHVEQVDAFSEVLNQLFVFSPEAREASNIINVDHQALKQV